VVRRKAEAELAQKRLSDLGEVIVDDVDDRPTSVADQVGVAAFAEVIDRRPDTGVDVLDQIELAQSLDHAIHGGGRDARQPYGDLADQVFGSEMVIAFGEHCDHRSRAARQPPSGLANDTEGALAGSFRNSWGGHVRTLSSPYRLGYAIENISQ
jgi:hypothetical protein